MADVHNKATRSFYICISIWLTYIHRNCEAIPIAIGMQQIKDKNTKPEMLVRTFLHANGYRYKLHDKRDAFDPKRFRLNLMTEKGTVPWDKHLQRI